MIQLRELEANCLHQSDIGVSALCAEIKHQYHLKYKHLLEELSN